MLILFLYGRCKLKSNQLLQQWEHRSFYHHVCHLRLRQFCADFSCDSCTATLYVVHCIIYVCMYVCRMSVCNFVRRAAPVLQFCDASAAQFLCDFGCTLCRCAALCGPVWRVESGAVCCVPLGSGNQPDCVLALASIHHNTGFLDTWAEDVWMVLFSSTMLLLQEVIFRGFAWYRSLDKCGSTVQPCRNKTKADSAVFFSVGGSFLKI